MGGQTRRGSNVRPARTTTPPPDDRVGNSPTRTPAHPGPTLRPSRRQHLRPPDQYGMPWIQTTCSYYTKRTTTSVDREAAARRSVHNDGLDTFTSRPARSSRAHGTTPASRHDDTTVRRLKKSPAQEEETARFPALPGQFWAGPARQVGTGGTTSRAGYERTDQPGRRSRHGNRTPTPRTTRATTDPTGATRAKSVNGYSVLAVFGRYGGGAGSRHRRGRGCAGSPSQRDTLRCSRSLVAVIWRMLGGRDRCREGGRRGRPPDPSGVAGPLKCCCVLRRRPSALTYGSGRRGGDAATFYA